MISQRDRVLTYVVLTAFAVFAFYPLLYVLSAALTPEGQAASLVPSSFVPYNFVEAWEIGRFGQYLRTSAMVSTFVVVVASAFSVLSGYAFGTMHFRGASVLFYVMLLGIMVPTEAIVVPLFFDLREIGLTNTFWALVLPQTAQSVAFGTFWMRAYFRSSPRSLVEAARLDGAGHFRTLWSVLLPMGRPAVVTMIVLVFMWTWNEFLIPLVMVTDESLRTAPLGLAFFQGQYTSGLSLLAAGAVIVAVPVVVVYLFLQRHFIRGMVDGAIKE
ncbi:MAG TPA: carbohydrate ABC transporter permease [Jiangellales bacterium]|nr:carbohydrate ABC transporter permease [Jiangellales bacterium]